MESPKIVLVACDLFPFEWIPCIIPPRERIPCVLILFTCLRLLCSCDRSCAWLFVKKYATLFVSIFCRFSVSFFLAWTPACLLAPWLAHSFVSFLLRFLLSKPWRCWEKEENNITFSPQKKGVIGDKIHINLFIAMSPPLQSPRTREAIFLFHFGTASSHAARRPWLVFALASFGVSWPTGRPNTFTVGRLSLKNKTLETCQTWKENIKHFQYSQIQQNLPRHSKVNHHLLTGNILFSNLAYNKLSMYS